MGFTEMFWKYMMKSAYLPKINILLQFGDEILALSCSSDSIQIVVFCLLTRLGPRQNYKDLCGVTGKNSKYKKSNVIVQ